MSITGSQPIFALYPSTVITFMALPRAVAANSWLPRQRPCLSLTQDVVCGKSALPTAQQRFLRALHTPLDPLA